MHRARLHLTATDDGLGSAAGTTAGFTAATAALRALVHVQLARLHGATATSRGTTTPGTLYASPHPLHSKTGVRLTISRPTPSSIRRIARARDCFDPFRATSVALGSPGDDTLFWSTVALCCALVHVTSLAPSYCVADVSSLQMRVGARTNPGVYPE